MRQALAAAAPVVRALAATQTQREFYHNAQRRGLLSMPINDIADVLADEHLRARGFFVPDANGAADLVAPFRSQPAMWRFPATAPRLGEYTEAFLTERLGCSRAEVEALVAMGAVSCGL
jgi:crotonobetainyl-CoA:carnitine CoA-transferase CaiB-like acyl-CoA transferase